MPTLISRKRPTAKRAAKMGKKKYREIILEPAMRLAAALDRLTRKAS